MKKIISLLLCFVMLLSLCACGSKNDPAAAPTEDPTGPEAGAGETITEEIEVDIPEELLEEEAPEEPTNDPIEIVRGLIDQPIEDLYAQIGEPQSSDYAPSCLGDGEDGMLFYDGFIVYTYREGDTETVYDVE